MDAVVSIVIPVYNVEKYLDRCLESVVNQTYRNLEILLIDDGATDACPQKCDDWAKRDSRIKVIHKCNAGLGMARNTGIEQASGEYICFFDSDDYVARNTVERALGLAKEETADLVVFGMSRVDRHGNVSRRIIPEADQVCYRAEEVLHSFLPSVFQPDLPAPRTRNLCLSACCCLFRMQLVQETAWRFVSERVIISEDIYSLLELYQNVRAVAVLKEALYYYCENDASLTHSYRPDRFQRNKQFYQACVDLCDRNGYPPVLRKSCMSPFLGNTIAEMKQVVTHNTQKKIAIRILREIVDDPLLQTVLESKKYDPSNYSVRILFWAMRHRCYGLCYLLLAVKIASKK